MKVFATAALVMLTAVQLNGQTRGQRPGGRGSGGFGANQNVIASIMEKSDQLGLNATQLERLEVIKVQLDSANAPQIEAMQDMRATGGRPDRNRMQSIFREIQANQNVATEAALAVLNDDQMDQARQIIESARPRRRRPGQRGGGRGGGGVRP